MVFFMFLFTTLVINVLWEYSYNSQVRDWSRTIKAAPKLDCENGDIVRRLIKRIMYSEIEVIIYIDKWTACCDLGY